MRRESLTSLGMRRLAILTAAILFVGLPLQPVARADANPFANADWPAILRSDPKLVVTHVFDPVGARYACFDQPEVSGCYVGGAAAASVGGIWLAAVPIDGMGTGGVMAIRLYEWSDGHARYLSTLGVYKAALSFASGHLVVKQPVYAPGECNACATHHSVTTYTIQVGKLVRASSVTLPGPLASP